MSVGHCTLHASPVSSKFLEAKPLGCLCAFLQSWKRWKISAGRSWGWGGCSKSDGAPAESTMPGASTRPRQPCTEQGRGLVCLPISVGAAGSGTDVLGDFLFRVPGTRLSLSWGCSHPRTRHRHCPGCRLCASLCFAVLGCQQAARPRCL